MTTGEVLTCPFPPPHSTVAVAAEGGVQPPEEDSLFPQEQEQPITTASEERNLMEISHEEVVVESCFNMPELGAEVLICAAETMSLNVTEEEVIAVEQETVMSDNSTIMDVDGGQDQHSRERPRPSRRVSYEEVVHSESDSNEDHRRKVGEEATTTTLAKCLEMLTQWALTLQEVYEDRQATAAAAAKSSRDVKGRSRLTAKCLCAKAASLSDDLRRLETVYYSVIKAHDDSEGDDDVVDSDEAKLLVEARSMQHRLRAEISIRISTSPSGDISQKAAFLVGEVCDVRKYVKDATDSVEQLVLDLQGVSECPEHAEDDECSDNTTSCGEEVEEGENEGDEDDSAMDEDDDEDKENQQNRKRKQSSNGKKFNPAPPTSPTSTPNKRARRGRTCSAPARLDTTVLELLESHKKLVRSDGLRQFVLWREAWKAERQRLLDGSSNVKRLSYS